MRRIPSPPSCASGREICFFGALPQVGNLGVRALTSSLVGLARATCPEARLSLLIGHRTGGEIDLAATASGTVRVNLVNYRLSPRARWREHLAVIVMMALIYRIVPSAWLRRRIRRAIPWIDALARADYLGDIRGGDSFSDIYGLRRLALGSLPNLTALLVGCPYVLLPQTYGPYRTAPARWIAAFVLRRARRVYARDRASRDLAAGLIGAHRHSPLDHDDRPPVEFYPPVEVCPDVAFTLAPRDAAEVQIAPPLPEAAPGKPAGGGGSAGGRLIGLNISGLLWAGGYTGRNMFGLACDYRALIRALLERLLADTPTRVLLVPHVTSSGVESDPAACRAAREALPEALRPRVHRLADPAEPGEVKAVIGRCDCLIGSRMHACIAALSQGIPAIGLAYSGKFAGVFESVGVADMVIDARSLDQEQILAACLERLGRLSDVRERLRERAPLAQARIRSVFEREFGQLARRHAAGVSRATPAQTAIAGL